MFPVSLLQRCVEGEWCRSNTHCPEIQEGSSELSATPSTWKVRRTAEPNTPTPSPRREGTLTLPDGTDVAGVLAVFRQTSSFFDPRTCLALIDGERVELEQVLEDGEEVHLYHLFSGG